MNFENKNFILAIVLSMMIIFGWQYFYAKPLQDKLTRRWYGDNDHHDHAAGRHGSRHDHSPQRP